MKPTEYYNFLAGADKEKLDFLYDKGLDNLNKFDSKALSISKVIVITCFLHFLMELNTVDNLMFYGLGVKKSTLSIIRMGIPLFLSGLNFLYTIYVIEKSKIRSFLNEIFCLKFDEEIKKTDSGTKITETHFIFDLLVQIPLGKSLIDPKSKFLTIFYYGVTMALYLVPFYVIINDLLFIYHFSGFVNLWYFVFVTPILLTMVTLVLFVRVIYIGILDLKKPIQTNSDV